MREDGSFSQAKIPTDLVARLEVAPEGSRELDALIWVATHPRGEMAVKGQGRQGPGNWRVRVHGATIANSWLNPEPVTTSLDAALALAERVLPGLCWSVGQNVHHKHWTAYGLHILPDGEVETVGLDSAATPALALCLAILRATTPGKPSSASEGVG